LASDTETSEPWSPHHHALATRLLGKDFSRSPRAIVHPGTSGPAVREPVATITASGLTDSTSSGGHFWLRTTLTLQLFHLPVRYSTMLYSSPVAMCGMLAANG
jgi:hypothetical protein